MENTLSQIPPIALTGILTTNLIVDTERGRTVKALVFTAAPVTSSGHDGIFKKGGPSEDT